jgi:hypothetical protein
MKPNKNNLRSGSTVFNDLDFKGYLRCPNNKFITVFTSETKHANGESFSGGGFIRGQDPKKAMRIGQWREMKFPINYLDLDQQTTFDILYLFYEDWYDKWNSSNDAAKKLMLIKLGGKNHSYHFTDIETPRKKFLNTQKQELMYDINYFSAFVTICYYEIVNGRIIADYILHYNSFFEDRRAEHVLVPSEWQLHGICN